VIASKAEAAKKIHDLDQTAMLTEICSGGF